MYRQEETQIGVLLRCEESEQALVAEAVRISGARPRALVVLAVAALDLEGLYLSQGMDGSRVRREADMAQRRQLRTMLEPLVADRGYSVARVGWPVLRSALSVASRERCGTLVISSEDAASARKRFWRLARREELRIVVVPA